MVVLYFIAVAFVASIFIPLALGPILVKLSNSTSTRPDIVIIDERELPPPVAYYFRSLGTRVEALGFKRVSYLRIDRAAKNASSFLMYLCNRDTMDLANSVTMFITGRPIALTVSYFEFCRKFADGSELETSNSSQPGVLARDPARLVFRFPGTDSPQTLWELHRKLVRKEKKFSQPFLPPEGTEIDAFRANYGKAIETQSTMGYFTRDGSSHIYRPTWKGACLMTWKLCWPIKQVRAALNRARTDRLLRDLYRA
jgi:hypothetical protein